MTVQQILDTCRQADIILIRVDGKYIDIDAPTGALTPELRAALTARKPELLAVLPRLEGMRRTLGHVPIPCARLEPCGGPGWCFSCGDALPHRDAYGRCEPCDLACELFYRECPDAAGRWTPAAEPNVTRRSGAR